MGHIVKYIVAPKNANRKNIVAEICYEVEHADWEENGHYHSRLTWHENKVYSCKQDAHEAIEKFDNGWYDDHAVLFLDLDAVKPTKSMEGIKARIEENRKAQAEFIANHHVRDRKSALIGCDKCGSKVAREYIPTTDRCPVCRNDLRPASTKDRIKRFEAKTKELEGKYLEAQKKLAAKAPVKWLVKYEYHV